MTKLCRGCRRFGAPNPQSGQGCIIFFNIYKLTYSFYKMFHVERVSDLRNVPRGTFLRFCTLPLDAPSARTVS